MAPIDPLQLLKALSPLLSAEGGIRSSDEVSRLSRTGARFLPTEEPNRREMWCRTVLSFSLLPFVFPLSQFLPVPLFFLCVRTRVAGTRRPPGTATVGRPPGDGPDTLPRARVGGVAKSKDSTVCSGRSALALPRRPRRILNDVVERL